MEVERIRPTPNEDSRPYWDGLKNGQLLIQKCDHCGRFRHYPRPVCSHCFSMDVTWAASPGRGKVHSWTVSHHAFHPAFKRDLPMILVTVDLAEGVRMCAQLRASDTTPFLGMPVRVAFERIDDSLTIPIFLPS